MCTHLAHPPANGVRFWEAAQLGQSTGVSVGLLIYLLVLWTGIQRNMIKIAYVLLAAVACRYCYPKQFPCSSKWIGFQRSAAVGTHRRYFLRIRSSVSCSTHFWVTRATPSLWHVSAYVVVIAQFSDGLSAATSVPVMDRPKYRWLLLIMVSIGPTYSLADGSAVTQIYSPYVQPLEKEIEFVWIHD